MPDPKTDCTQVLKSTIPLYKELGYKTYNDYTRGREFTKTKDRLKKRHPKSRYCFVCDCRGFLDLHHLTYKNMPREKRRDMKWLCDPRCSCQHNCHYRGHKDIFGSPLPKYYEYLYPRLVALRKEYVRKNLKPSTLWLFLKIWLYRKVY